MPTKASKEQEVVDAEVVAETSLAVVPQADFTGLTPAKIELIKRTIAKGATDDELEMFILYCRKTGLDPFSKQIYAVKRNTKDGEVLTTQVSIDGLRVIAQRSGKYQGQKGPYFCGEDGEWKEVWLEEKPPKAAKVGVVRSDFIDPLYAVALWTSYVPVYSDGSVSTMWRKMPDVMLAKVAESLALRKAFPAEMSGIYSTEEMAQADRQPEVILAEQTLRKATTAARKEFSDKLISMGIDGLPSLEAFLGRRVLDTETLQNIIKEVETKKNA